MTAPATSPGAPADDRVDVDAARGEGTPPPPWGWHLSRVTGLVLAVLLPIQVLRTFVLNDVARTTARAMTVRWSDPLARVLDGAVLVLALVHGATALAPRLAARAHSGRAARLATGAVWVVSGGLALAVTAVVLTYRFT